MIDKYKIHKIVEYIKVFGFEFETDEVIENLNEVLANYDILDFLSDDEYYFLIDELLPMAEQFEFREVGYLASQDDPLITQIPEKSFDLRIEAIERKLARHNTNTSDFLQGLAVA